MSDPNEPARLKTLDGAHPGLKRALDALGNEDVDSARLARVANALGPLLDAAPPTQGLLIKSALLKTALRLARTKLFAVGVATFAIGTTALLWNRNSSDPVQSESVAEAPSSAAKSEPVSERVAEPALPEPVTVPAAETRQAEKTEAVDDVTPRSRAHRARRATQTARATSGNAPRESEATPSAASGTPSSVTAGTETEATKTPEREPDRVAEEAESEQQAPPPRARKASEVELLQQARMVVDDDPREALRLLDEHGSRFANGLLAPEREVLAIEALRKMGDSAAADRRLRAFRAHYPDSLHLRRLERRTND